MDQQNLKISRADLAVRENEGQVPKFEVDKKLLQYLLSMVKVKKKRHSPGRAQAVLCF